MAIDPPQQEAVGIEPVEEVPESDSPGKSPGIWRRGLAQLRRVLTTPLGELFRRRPISEEVFAELEESLLGADVGVQVTTQLIERLRDRCRREKPEDASALRAYLKEEILALLQKFPVPPLVGEPRPWVILVVGVNGVGKTTTIAKLAARFSRERKKVLLVAADTFRAAASEQLEIWAGRVGVDIVKHQSGASPAAVAFDGIRAAVARKTDVVIVDTAGRLHTKSPLMEELKKIHRIVARELSGAPHEVLLVLDASTGQNALQQALAFQQALPLTGVILAKMDGSAKGGMILAVTERLGLPVRCVGLGEKVEDLQDFSAVEFVDALFSPEEAKV
ncbi:MAG: signal recognition particle-docking protein FtsY [Deltaproteobacteria bacterium]|nr:signal recognition particle-docking protein FtsY [Deltaproteobacteria bacterium]